MDLVAPARPAAPSARDAEPRRVLVITASVGEGHNRAATAIAAGLARRDPAADVRVCDLFHLTGFSGEGERRRFRLAVELFPRAYQAWYDAVARWGPAHRYYRDRIGPRVGAGLREVIAEADPDVVVSTYPLATAGLGWLRRTGRLDTPVLAFLADFAPHRFWAYPGVDRYLVQSEGGRAAVGTLAPDVPAEACAPAVDAGFAPPDAERARRARERFGLPADGMVVLVSAGSMAMGSVRHTVRAVRRAGVHVVVTCGRNRWLSRSLRRQGDAGVTPIDWTDDMPDLLAACDVVVNNAGGMTAAEARATGRALVMFRPIAGHGRASARLMAAEGLAATCTAPGELTGLLAGWAARPERLREVQRRTAEHAGGYPDAAEEVLRACPARRASAVPSGRPAATCPGGTAP